MTGYVYIVTNHKHGTLYIGVTSDLERRIYEHREALTPGFTSKYGCKQLVWYKEFWNIRTPSSGKNRSNAGIGNGRSI